jgi:hypothetical protein
MRAFGMPVAVRRSPYAPKGQEDSAQGFNPGEPVPQATRPEGAQGLAWRSRMLCFSQFPNLSPFGFGAVRFYWPCSLG